MRIGVDSSVLIAGMHANHPMHAVAARWLTDHLASDELWVTHHAVLECYAVLTRLPAELRVTGEEARRLIDQTIRQNMELMSFDPDSLWEIIEELAGLHVMGGRAYDAFQIAIHQRNGIRAIATFNTRHFADVAPNLRIIDPSVPGDLDGS